MCINQPVTLHPWAAAKSGNKYKYNGFAASTLFPASTQAIIVSKSVNPTFLSSPNYDGGYGAGIAQWTVTLHNTTTSPLIVNKINDIIPSCMTISNATAPSSQITTSNSSSVPAVGSTSAVSWTGITPISSTNWQYQVPASGALNLVYQTNVSGCTTSSNYSNYATAVIGNIISNPATATLTIGCTATTSVTIHQLPILSTTQTDVTCNSQSDGSATVIPTGGTMPYTYIWNTIPAQSTATISGLAAGSYSVSVTDANNCTTTTTVIINEPPLLATSVAGVDVTTPGGSDGSADMSVAGGIFPFIYNWSNSAITEDISGLSAGIYSVTVTDVNGCTAYSSIVISEPTSHWCNKSAVLSQVWQNMGGDTCAIPDIIVDIRLGPGIVDPAKIGTDKPATGSLQARSRLAPGSCGLYEF